MQPVEELQAEVETQPAIHDLLRRRWSPRAFSARPVEPEKLRSLLEAARWAPSSYNEQPWNFLVVRRDNPQEFERMVSVLADSNALWASQAPVLVLSVAKTYFERNREPNRHAFHDVGLAVGNLSIQATALGLYVHQMAGFDAEKARKLFAIPEGYQPVTMIAVGYLSQPDGLPDPPRERENAPRRRKPLEDFVFTGRWGETSAVLTTSEAERG